MNDGEIHFFLSSTFRDLRQERIAIVKLVDRLRPVVEPRGVHLSITDLRWGITEEESTSGKVMELCLDEIDRSQPFFIGIIGSQYGTTLSKYDVTGELLERYPFVLKDIENGYSITEIEIQYGALRRNEAADAIFLIKEEENTVVCDERLNAFKQRIRSQKRYPVASFRNVDDMCIKAEDLILSLIQKRYPDNTISAAQRHRQVQRSYLKNHHIAFVGREDELLVLNRFLYSDDSILAITGERGCGKSALLANWIEGTFPNNNYHLFCHFLANSSSDNSPDGILKHLKDEILDYYPILNRDSGINHNQSVVTEITKLLCEAKANSEKPMIIILDGLNNLADEDKLLTWLPKVPGFIKFILSTVRGDQCEETLKRWKCTVYGLNTLPRPVIKQFVSSYLFHFGKKFSSEEADLLLSAPISSNLIAVKTALNELVRFGEFGALHGQILQYNGAKDLSEFYRDFVLRLKGRYGKDGHMVLHAMILISLSQNGLTHEEIVDFTNGRAIDWKSFYYAFESLFIERNGLVSFSNYAIKDAITDFFLVDSSDLYVYRQELIDGFTFRVNDNVESMRRWTSEVSFQFYSVGDADKLFEIISQLGHFMYFYHFEEASLVSYWRWLIQKDSEKYSLSVYLSQCQDAEDCLWVGMFIYKKFADCAVSYSYAHKAISYLGNDKNSVIQSEYRDIQNMFAWLSYKTGRVQESIVSYLDMLKSLESNNSEQDAKDYFFANNNLASIYSDTWEFEKARVLLEKNIALCEAKGWDTYTALSYSQMGSLEHRLANKKIALDMLQKAIDILYPRFGDNDESMQIILKETGEVYDSMGDYPKALALLNRALESCRHLYGDMHPETAAVLSNIGLVYYNLTDYQTALKYCEESRRTYERLGQVNPMNLNRLGIILGRLGYKVEAVSCLKTAIKTLLSQGGKVNPALADFYSNLAGVCFNDGLIDRAFEYESEALRIKKHFLPETHPDYLWSLSNMIILLKKTKQLNAEENLLLQANDLMQKGQEHGFVYDNQTVETIIEEMICYYERRDNEEGLKYLHLMHNYLAARYGDDSMWAACGLMAIGNGYLHFLYWDSAAEYYMKAYRIMKKDPTSSEGQWIRLLESLGETCFRIGEYNLSIQYYNEKLDELKKDGRWKNRQEIRRIENIIRVAKLEMIHPTIINYWKNDKLKPY